MKSRSLIQLAAVAFASVLCGAAGLGAQPFDGLSAVPSAVEGQGGPPQAPPAPPKPGQLAPDYYKNIKMLTKVPADQLRTQMEFFAASLGVQCNFCHVQGQFDSDENPHKDRARKMMQMVDRFNDNPANDVTVTCATCHHGHVPPERTPTLVANMSQAEADAAAAARAARGGGPGGGGQGRGPGGAPGGGPGGQAALAQAKTRVAEGTQTTRDLQTTPIRIQEKITGEYRIDVASQPNPAVRVSTPTAAWATGQGPNPRDLEGLQAAQVARPSEFGIAPGLKTKYANLTVRRYENVDGKPAIVVDGRRGAVVDESLYFDRESGLLARRLVQTKTAYGNLAEQIDYSDYRDAGGIKVPFQIRHTTWSQVTTEKFTDIKVNAPIDDAVFVKK